MAAPKKAVGPKSDKLWRQAIMLAVNRLSQDGKTKHLDILAHRLVKSAAEGDVSALKEIGDRLDGRPSQEATVTFSDKRDATDWTRDELVAFLNNTSDGSEGTPATQRRPKQSDSVH